jgi:hypothetical protein
MGIDPDLRILMLQLDDPGRDALERVIARAQAESKQRAVATTQPQPQPQPRSRRKPSISRAIAQAERSGRHVSSVTTSDGMTLNFDQQPTEANNPWLADIERQTKQ